MEYERRSNLKQLTNSTIGFIKFSTLGVIRLWYLNMSSWCIGGRLWCVEVSKTANFP